MPSNKAFIEKLQALLKLTEHLGDQAQRQSMGNMPLDAIALDQMITERQELIDWLEAHSLEALEDDTLQEAQTLLHAVQQLEGIVGNRLTRLKEKIGDSRQTAQHHKDAVSSYHSGKNQEYTRTNKQA